MRWTTLAMLCSIVCICTSVWVLAHHRQLPRPYSVTTPYTDPAAQQHEQKVQAAMWEAAKVFGRAPGCQDADPELGRMAADAALAHEIDTKLVAATIAVESGCNPYATSSKGAIGLMQVMPSIWKTTYDFQGKVNLLNRQNNITVGTDILATYIKKYGKSGGILHYQGTGTGCPTCDGQYTSKILRLADGK